MYLTILERLTDIYFMKTLPQYIKNNMILLAGLLLKKLPKLDFKRILKETKN